jgi:hypothetical protein
VKLASKVVKLSAIRLGVAFKLRQKQRHLTWQTAIELTRLTQCRGMQKLPKVGSK